MTSTPQGCVRLEIELAWHRAQLAGLTPGMSVRESVLTEVDRRSRLMLAAEPVLERLAQDLADTRFTVLLADSASVIVERRFGRRSLTAALDQLMAVPGSRYTESVSGTNSLATAHELRRPISVTGTEHFLEAMQRFSCYGAPIMHPATRRLEGVLDITGPVDDASKLLAPFLMHAVRDIEQHLLDGSRVAEQRMLAAFQTQAANRPNPVVALSDDVLLANRHAVDLLHAVDHAALRELAIDAPRSGVRETVFGLDAGRPVRIRYERVPDSPGGVIFDFDPELLRRSDADTRPPARSAGRAVVTRVLVHGEPGTGRTRHARVLAGPDAQVLSGQLELSLGTEIWLGRARHLLGSGRPVVFDDVTLLSAAAAVQLAKLLDEYTDTSTVLVAGELPGQSAEHASLTTRCVERSELAPLRHRCEQFAGLVRDLLAELPGGAGRQLTPSAEHILEAHPWPGNVRELRAVLAAAAEAHRSGDITGSDLPVAYRISPRRRHLGLLEQAEHDMIVTVLAEEAGNKSRAAARLGIGRNTLYDRIRRLGIPT